MAVEGETAHQELSIPSSRATTKRIT